MGEQFIEIGGRKFLRRVLLFVDDVKRDFATTSTKELAKRFNTSTATIYALSKCLGLKKDAGYLERLRLEKLQMAQKVLRATNGFQTQNLHRGGNYLKEWKENATQEQIDAMREKVSIARRELYKAERRRVNWGLPQKTKLNVVAQPIPRAAAKRRLRVNGYTEIEKNRFLVPDTNRHPKQEAFMVRKWGFIFIEREKENDDATTKSNNY